MKTRILLALFVLGFAFSQASLALVVDLDVSTSSPDFRLNIYDGTDAVFRLTTQFEGDARPHSGEVCVLGALDGMPDSIVIEQRIQYVYGSGPYMTGPNFTPILFADADFFDDPLGIYPIREDIFYDSSNEIGYATENNSGQLDALYAVQAIGDGHQRTDISDGDHPGVLYDSHAPRIGGDSGINVGVSFSDPGLMAGDIVCVTYRHLFAFGEDAVPTAFVDVPEPSEIVLMLLGLIALVSVTARKDQFANKS